MAWTVSEGRWIPYDHLLLLNRKLVDVAAGRIKRLMVFMPPRHGKSELVSRYFPAWFLGTFPDSRVILASYEADFASTWGRKARNLLEEYGPALFGVNVATDSSAASRWDIADRDGGMTTAGVRGPITGKGAKIAILDDVVKNDQEAESKTYRDATWDWYLATFSTRLQDDGAVILVMTRWNEDDLAGRLLQAEKEGGEHWEVLKLPALSEENDPLGRSPDEPLCPELFPKATLEAIRGRLGSYWWAALYQQRPAPQGGTIFKKIWFRYFHREPGCYILHRPEGDIRIDERRCWIFQTVDPAATENEKSDFFVCSTWAVTPDMDLLLLDVFREKAETTKHKTVLRSQRDKWHPGFQGVENKTFGLNIIQEAKKDGAPVRPLSADRDKVSRARPIAARYELGTVYHLANAPWLEPYESELVAFPNGEKDDQVDTAGYAGIVLIDEDVPQDPAALALLRGMKVHS